MPALPPFSREALTLPLVGVSCQVPRLGLPCCGGCSSQEATSLSLVLEPGHILPREGGQNQTRRHVSQAAGNSPRDRAAELTRQIGKRKEKGRLCVQ